MSATREESLRILFVEDQADDAELAIRELKRAEIDCAIPSRGSGIGSP